jgi:hypothetical protein
MAGCRNRNSNEFEKPGAESAAGAIESGGEPFRRSAAVCLSPRRDSCRGDACVALPRPAGRVARQSCRSGKVARHRRFIGRRRVFNGPMSGRYARPTDRAGLRADQESFHFRIDTEIIHLPGGRGTRPADRRMIVQTPLGEAGASPSQRPDKPAGRRTGNGCMDREMESGTLLQTKRRRLPSPPPPGGGGWPGRAGRGRRPCFDVANFSVSCFLSPESYRASPPPLPPLPGHPLPRSLGGEGKASSGASLVSSTFSVKNKGARASTPAMRAGGSRTAVSFFSVSCFLSPESYSASLPPLPPLPGHPLPRSLGGEGKASVRASLVSSTFRALFV